MMKKRKKQITRLLKLGVFLFGFSLLLWNCEKEDEILDSPQPQFFIAHKNFSSVTNNSNLLKKLEELSSYKTKNKNLFKEKVIVTNDFTIFTERVTYTKPTDGSRESYTFYIERNGYKEPNSVENLILSKKVNEVDFKASIITYYFPNGIINNPNEVFEIVKYEQIDAKIASNVLAKGCENTYEYVVEETKHDCYTGEHSGVSEEGDCNYATNGGTPPYSTWSIHVKVTYQCDGGETGGLSDPGGLSEGDTTGTSTTGDNPDATIDTGITLPPNCQTDNCSDEITANTINELLDNKLTEQELLWLFYNETQADYLKSFLLENSTTEAKNFAKEITNLISLESNVDNNALSFVFEAFNQNKIYNKLDHSFLESVNQYMDVDISSMENTDPIVQHFIFKMAMLRALNPNWSKTKVFWEATKEGIHISLDVFGLVPVVGEIADLTNGALYAIEGDGVNATLSFASAIPVVGYGSVVTKYGLKIVKASTIGTRVKLVWKITANGVEFGSRGTLRKVLGITDSALHAHHLIPWAQKIHPLVQKAAKSKHAFHLNEALNGIPRLNSLHLTGHKVYNSKILEILNRYDKLINPNASFDEAYDFVTGLANHIKTLIKDNPTLNSGQIADLISYP